MKPNFRFPKHIAGKKSLIVYKLLLFYLLAQFGVQFTANEMK